MKPDVVLPFELADRLLVRLEQCAGLIPGVAVDAVNLRNTISAAETDAELHRLAPHRDRTSSSTAPPWHYVRPAADIVSEMLSSDVGLQARADGLGAYVRETFDGLELSLYDEATVYVALSTAALMVEMSRNGATRGQVLESTVEEVAKVSSTFTAALLPYIPTEGS